MKKTFSVLLSALCASSALAAPTAISGIAKDGSKGGKPLANAVVQLVRPGDKGTKTPISSVTTDAAGRFTFPARQYSASELLMVNVNRQGFDYWAVAYDGANNLKKVGINVNPQKVDLLVFDTSTQPVPLDFQVHHLAIESTETGLKCIERIVVHNHSNTTLLGVGPRKISVLLDIPKGAKNVKLDPKITDAKLLETKDGWGVSKAITPDAYGVSNALIISYNVDWPSQMPWAKKIDLSRKTVYPTKFFFVARTEKDKGLLVSSPKLSGDTEAPVPIDGKTETRLVNSIGAPMMPEGGAPPALPDNQTLDIKVSKPVSSTFWGFAAMTVALCLFLPLAMMKPRKNGAGKAQGAKRAEPSYGGLVSEQTSVPGGVFPALNGFGTDLALTQSSRDLIQKIADLDDQHEAGALDLSEYQSRRAAWKKQLIESLGNSTQH
ncbi:MAG TPA: carboxypeptidase-like regulatory domain-containing protein [Abditibacterium sp.]